MGPAIGLGGRVPRGYFPLKNCGALGCQTLRPKRFAWPTARRSWACARVRAACARSQLRCTKRAGADARAQTRDAAAAQDRVGRSALDRRNRGAANRAQHVVARAPADRAHLARARGFHPDRPLVPIERRPLASYLRRVLQSAHDRLQHISSARHHSLAADSLVGALHCHQCGLYRKAALRTARLPQLL
eukprot:6565568-Prymnesium_polylepis.1